MADGGLDKRANEGLSFVRSLDGGTTFDDITKLNTETDSGEAQVAALNDAVYVVSGGLDSMNVHGPIFMRSNDGGKSFSEPVRVDENGTFINPTNVEVGAYNEQLSYVATQVSVSDNEEIFLLEMNGNDSTGVFDLSNNAKISRVPIALAGNNIYVVWEDMTPGNHDILYAKGIRA